MKRLIRRWLNRYKNLRSKKKFESKSGIDLQSLITACEEIVFNQTGKKVYTKFRDLGGANNYGMLMHYFENNNAVAISKIEENILAEREYRFLKWQKDYRDNSLSAEPFGLTPVLGTKYSCFISSVLEHPKQFSYTKAECLFDNLGQHPDLLSKLALSKIKKDLKDELDDSTKIKSILVHLVSKFGTINSEKFYKRFLLDRENIFSNDHDAFINIKSLMDEVFSKLKNCDLEHYEGLVHGDFKSQNILEDDAAYKVIDCQYYTYGIRFWDLAFLYSKDSGGFKNIKIYLEKLLSFEEKSLMLFFYVIASLINVKKKRASAVMKNKISPAAEYINQLLELRE
jgi:hypothetical protein